MAGRSQQGLQQYDIEVTQVLDDLVTRRSELEASIQRDTEEANSLAFDIRVKTEKLNKLKQALQQKEAAKSEYDKIIDDTQASYSKLLEASRMLVQSIKKENMSLSQRKV
ncbi:putative sjoegren syndrome nuclear autoantigen 1 [Blattamonas nauphoetae]|uniref:Sjoegren syndrome nuclear autoantigen 1 n=1 Tax=Blattamonas nauphoetae TaxID=2049346 RepID=A0ABQ9YME6_9EUKA|nr:putative sjoegren syndrome nuclear autoantigen 1 [Blattamonas nauphoetae]